MCTVPSTQLVSIIRLIENTHSMQTCPADTSPSAIHDRILFNEDQRAGYLPTDFFSGDETRIHCALIALYRAHHKWLRIFQDGRLLDKNNEPEMGNELIHAAAHALEVEQRCLEKVGRRNLYLLAERRNSLGK